MPRLFALFSAAAAGVAIVMLFYRAALDYRLCFAEQKTCTGLQKTCTGLSLGYAL